MDKKSYRNKRLERLNTEFNLNLPGQASGEEGLSGDAGNGVGRGLVMPGESVMPATHSEAEDREEFPKKKRKTHDLEYDKLLALLIDLSDGMDKQEEYRYSNFADFLIQKIAQQKNLDYQVLLKDLLIKINNSDIMGKQSLIKSIVKEYNSLLIESVEDGGSESEAHNAAYHVVAQMVVGHV